MIDWNQRYGGDAFFYGTEPNEFLRDRVDAIPAGGRVLSLGEGEGRNAVFLATRGYDVVAIDQSATGMHKARLLAERTGVRIDTIVGDLATYAIEPAHWDGIVSIWCHVPGSLRATLHRQVVAGLRPGGAYLIEAYTPDQIGRGTGGPRDPDLLPTLAQLRRELDGLELLHAVELQRDVHEGHGHTGHSAVVQVVARRPATR